MDAVPRVETQRISAPKGPSSAVRAIPVSSAVILRVAIAMSIVFNLIVDWNSVAFNSRLKPCYDVLCLVPGSNRLGSGL